MRGIVIASVGIALALGFGPRLSAPTADADATGNVVIGCEFLAAAIDGDLDDETLPADLVEACDGLDAADIGNATLDVGLADALGDADGTLEESDFADIDKDGNQIVNAGGFYASTYLIEFVNDEGPTTFDVPAGLTVSNGATPAATFSGGEVCTTDTDDNDCGVAGVAGDGVLVARITDGTASAGDTKTVKVTQTAVEDTADIVVTGAPHDVWLTTAKAAIQTSGTTTDADVCKDESDVSDSSQAADVNRTFVIAAVTDSDGTKLTRVVVKFESSAVTKATFDDDDAEIASDPKAFTGESVDAGSAGVASFAVICGGTATGTATITATINDALASEDSDSVELTVVGVPASIALTAAPAQIACDGTQTASVTAKVTDSAGNNVADGNSVNFSVVALGTANPINAKTAAGAASSTITPLSGATAGVTVIVTAGDAQASIRVDCMPPANPDFFSQPVEISVMPFTDSRSTSGFGLEQGEPTPCNLGGATVWYRFTSPTSPPFNGQVALDTFGSDFDTVIAVYSGGWSSSPPGGGGRLIECNDDNGGSQSRLSFHVDAGATYYIQVGGKGTEAGSLAFHADAVVEVDTPTPTPTATATATPRVRPTATSTSTATPTRTATATATTQTVRRGGGGSRATSTAVPSAVATATSTPVDAVLAIAATPRPRQPGRIVLPDTGLGPAGGDRGGWVLPGAIAGAALLLVAAGVRRRRS